MRTYRPLLVLLLLVTLSSTSLLQAQSIYKRWYPILIPTGKINIFGGTGQTVLDVSKDSIKLVYLADSLTGDSPYPEAVSERFKITKVISSRHGDSFRFIAKDVNGKYTGLRFVAIETDRYTVGFAEEDYGDAKSVGRSVTDNKFIDIFTVVDEKKYAELRMLRDPAEITETDLIAILKDLRSTIGNMNAQPELEKQSRSTQGMALLVPLNAVIASSLELRGYSPVKWTKSVEAIVSPFEENKEVAQLIEELRQMTK
jgi:hypothetical protein